MNLWVLVTVAFFFQAEAFRDTSPFFLFSSSTASKSIAQFSQEQIKSRAEVFKTTELFLSHCPSDTYLILTQPSISATEFSNKTSNFRQFSENPNHITKFLVRDAIGLKIEDGEKIVRYLEKRCGSKRVNAWPLSNNIEQHVPGENLAILNNLGKDEIMTDDSPIKDKMASVTRGEKYTVIFITTPNYLLEKFISMDDHEKLPTHAELRRGLTSRGHAISSDADLRTLFGKYQFLSPGLFVGILVSLILLAILSVGVRAISSLEVSYGAFDKELGPTNLKKQ